MYSVILATALSTAGASQQFGHHGWGGYYGWGWGNGWGSWNYCSGCFGCYGYGCYGWGCYGGYGYPYWGGYWGYPYWGGYWGGYWGAAPTTTNPDAPLVARTEKKSELKKQQRASDAQPRGIVVVDVPDDAKVYLNGKLMRSTSTRRVYQTPVLEEGETYFYDIQVDVVRDGRTMSQSKRVVINPGQRSVARFDELERKDLTAQNAGK
jgi:uncharacterized protein (TIGR03000 family)